MTLDNLATFLGYGALLMLWFLLRLRVVRKGLLVDLTVPPAPEPPPSPELRRERSLWMLMCVPWLLWAVAEIRVGHVDLPLLGWLQASPDCVWKPGPHAGEQQYVCDDGEQLASDQPRSDVSQ